jgi:hypothetical protein
MIVPSLFVFSSVGVNAHPRWNAPYRSSLPRPTVRNENPTPQTSVRVGLARGGPCAKCGFGAVVATPVCEPGARSAGIAQLKQALRAMRGLPRKPGSGAAKTKSVTHREDGETATSMFEL